MITVEVTGPRLFYSVAKLKTKVDKEIERVCPGGQLSGAPASELQGWNRLKNIRSGLGAAKVAKELLLPYNAYKRTTECPGG